MILYFNIPWVSITLGPSMKLSNGARRRSLRRQVKTIRRKIEVAEHDLAAALGNNPSEANLFEREHPSV